MLAKDRKTEIIQDNRVHEKDTGSVFLGRDYTSVQKNFSQEVALAIDNEIRKIVSDAHDLARKTLLKHKEDLILIAETLLEKETINAEEIDYLLKHRSLDGFNSNAQKEQQKEVVLTEEPPKEIKVEKEKPSKKGEKEEA